MRKHLPCLRHLETRGPTTRVAFAGAVAAAAPGTSSYLADATPELRHTWPEHTCQPLEPQTLLDLSVYSFYKQQLWEMIVGLMHTFP